MRAIGGFLPLEQEQEQPAHNVLEFWNIWPGNHWAFSNARSALAHLLRENSIRRLWLPALICPELVSAAGTGCSLAFYPLDKDLSPDVTKLAGYIQAGDCVVAVDYFGRQPKASFRDYVVSRPDILWVEDRAQALAPAVAPWADLVLYSPRKLFGVADGGFLVRADGRVGKPDYTGADVVAAVTARDIGRGDPDWRFGLYQETERRSCVSMQAMSRLSQETLANIDPEPVIRRRRENFDTLDQLLGDVALLTADTSEFAPMGFPVRISECEQVWQRMCRRGIFPARHFAILPSEASAFPFEHDLGASMMTLPCDQRYDSDDMRQVAAVFREALG